MNKTEFPSDNQLVEQYQQIAQTAREYIETGLLVVNPLLRQNFRGNESWSISTHGLMEGSAAGAFLAEAQKRLVETANFAMVPSSFLHISFTELLHIPGRRRIGSISFPDVRSYHGALLHNFPQKFDPIRLNLHSIIPTLDKEEAGKRERTGAVVGAFLTDDNSTVFQVKEALVGAVTDAGLLTSAKYGKPPKVLFVTLGRFIEPPYKTDNRIPFFEEVDKLNSQLKVSAHKTDIEDIHVISTSPLDYASPRGHIELWPSVALSKEDQIQGSFKLLKPSERLWYYRMKELLRRQ